MPLPKTTPTPRELDIARLIAEGQPNKVIANRLGLSYYTVKVHRERFRRKLGLGNAADIARWVRENLQTAASQ